MSGANPNTKLTRGLRGTNGLTVFAGATPTLPHRRHQFHLHGAQGTCDEA
jgi:hypothetical protein